MYELISYSQSADADPEGITTFVLQAHTVRSVQFLDSK